MQRRDNFRPRLLREAIIPDFAFRAVSREFPAARAGEIQQKEGTCRVRPTYCFRPRDAQVEAATYPVRIRVYDLGQSKLHGVAEPLQEAQLTRDELLEVHQIKRVVVFTASERRENDLIARDEATGMFILPAADWMAGEIKGIDMPAPGQACEVLLEEFPNKFVAQPVKSGQDVKEQALVVAERSGMATLFHATHVVSADGKRWLHFRDVLWLQELEFSADDVRRQFRRLSGGMHPDTRATVKGALAKTRQGLAEAKMHCLGDARDRALDWLKGCPAKLKSGDRKGQRCGKKRADNSAMCNQHAANQDVGDALADALAATLNGNGGDMAGTDDQPST